MEIIYEEGLEPSKYTKDIIECVEKTLRPNSVRGSHKDIVAHITGANDIRIKVPSYTELCKECHVTDLSVKHPVSTLGAFMPNVTINWTDDTVFVSPRLTQLVSLYSKYTGRYVGTIGTVSTDWKAMKSYVYDDLYKKFIDAGYLEDIASFENFDAYTLSPSASNYDPDLSVINITAENIFKSLFMRAFQHKYSGFSDPKKNKDILFIDAPVLKRDRVCPINIKSESSHNPLINWQTTTRQTHTATMRPTNSYPNRSLMANGKNMIRTFVRGLVSEERFPSSTCLDSFYFMRDTSESGVLIPSKQQADLGMGLPTDYYADVKDISRSSASVLVNILGDTFRRIFREASSSMEKLEEDFNKWVLTQTQYTTAMERGFWNHESRIQKIRFFNSHVIEEYIADNEEASFELLQKIDRANRASELYHNCNTVLVYLTERDVWYVITLSDQYKPSFTFLQGYSNLPNKFKEKVQSLDMAKQNNVDTTPVIPRVGFLHVYDGLIGLNTVRLSNLLLGGRYGQAHFYYIDKREPESVEVDQVSAKINVNTDDDLVSSLLEKFGG